MKGIVFLLCRQVIRDERGEDAVEDLLAEAGLPSSFAEGEDYPDAQLEALIEAAGPYVPTGEDEAARWIGRNAIEKLAVEYPSFFQPYASIVGLVADLDEEIHPEVQKIFPDATFPRFEIGDGSDADLVVAYRSERDLCLFAEGLIDGAAGRYGETVRLEQTACTHRGDPHCRIELTLAD